MPMVLIAMLLLLQQPQDPLPPDPADEALRAAGRETAALALYRFDIRVVVEGLPEAPPPLLAAGTFASGSGVRGSCLTRGINQDFCWQDGRFAVWDVQASGWRPRQAPDGAPMGAFAGAPHEELAAIVDATAFVTQNQKSSGSGGRLRIFETTLDPRRLPRSIAPPGIVLPPKGVTAEARLVADEAGAIRVAGLTVTIRSEGGTIRFRREIILGAADPAEAAIPEGPASPFRSAE